MEHVQREFLLSFWKAHILQKASANGVYGLEIIQNLREQGYQLSPGTLYPILKRMERAGWLTSRQAAVEGKIRRSYEITASGRTALRRVRRALADLHREVVRKKNTFVD